MPSQTVLPPGIVFRKMFHRFIAEKKLNLRDGCSNLEGLFLCFLMSKRNLKKIVQLKMNWKRVIVFFDIGAF